MPTKIKNITGSTLFSHFCSDFSLKRVSLSHPTYHHFVGDGVFDSEIDVLLFHGPDHTLESLDQILCKLESPLINSHHDAILSSCSLPGMPVPSPDEDLVQAPRIPNKRLKIVWDDEGIEKYESLDMNSLTSLRDQWGDPTSRSAISVLLASTYSCLSFAASSTNQSIELGTKKTPKPFVCQNVRQAEIEVFMARKNLNCLNNTSTSSTQSVELAKKQLVFAKASCQS